MKDQIKIFITFHIAPELLSKIKSVDPKIEILYDPSLLGEPRYTCDQHGGPIKRSPEQDQKLQSMMAETEILFGYLPTGYGGRDIKKWFPKLRWNQSPSAGIGWGAKESGLIETDITFTTAGGVHNIPLAEFCIMSMLMFTKNYFLMAEGKEKKHWARNCSTDLSGKTLAIVGLGKAGKEIVKLAKCLGMHVIGTKRTVDGVDPANLNVDAIYSNKNLKPMLTDADFLVLICPETEETRGLIGKEEITYMKPGAVLINISKGAVVDEDALVDALLSGHLGGAALDVFRTEPLPLESPLWNMPRVIISPHSSSTDDKQNERLTDVFVDNLHRYLASKPLNSVLDKKLLY
jgi:phosphoglycerate dehydrogenase-like enzyme